MLGLSWWFMKLPRVPSFVALDLAFFHDPTASPRPAWWRAWSAVVLVLVVLGVFLASGALAPPRALVWSDKHRNTALEIAINRVLCGTESRLSPAFPIARQLEDHPELHDVPMRDFARRLAGSPTAYCHSVVQPFLGGENSLMLEMTLFLSADPQLSFRGLGWCLQGSRVAALVLFAFVLLENGASLWFAGAVLSSGLGILGYLSATAHYSVYPFLPVLLVLEITLLSYCLQRGLSLGVPAHIAVAGLAGWLMAFAVNMRSSHLPVYAAFLALYFVAGERLARGSRSCGSRLRWLGAGVLSAGLCYGLFGLLFIRPLTQDSAGGQTRPHHPVAHALVLGLAVPENDLSRREGIEWEDSAGLSLARRIDPKVSYLREGYESALFTYYRRLWARHPREMLEIYWRKLQIAGRSMISKLSASPAGPLIWPLAWIPNGGAFLLLHAALAGFCLGVHSRRGSPFAFTLALVATAGFLLQLESALVFPVFDMTHHSSQVLCFMVLVMLAWQLPLEVLRLAFRRARARPSR